MRKTDAPIRCTVFILWCCMLPDILSVPTGNPCSGVRSLALN